MMERRVTEMNINEFGRFDVLKATIDKAKAKFCFESLEVTKIIPPKVNMKVDKLLRDFIINGGFDLEKPNSNR